MKRGVVLVLLGVCLAASGCHEQPPPQEGSGPPPQPIAITKAEPPPYCEALGSVSGSSDDYYLDLRQQALDMGANLVVLDGEETHGYGWSQSSKFVGRAFLCPPPPRYPPPQARYPVATARPATTAPPQSTAPQPAPPAPSASAPAGCQPPCSPGYDCQQNRCVPLCNPKCAPTQYCAADRTCRAR